MTTKTFRWREAARLASWHFWLHHAARTFLIIGVFYCLYTYTSIRTETTVVAILDVLLLIALLGISTDFWHDVRDRRLVRKRMRQISAQPNLHSILHAVDGRSLSKLEHEQKVTVSGIAAQGRVLGLCAMIGRQHPRMETWGGLDWVHAEAVIRQALANPSEEAINLYLSA